MNLSYPFSLISGKGLGVSYSSLTQIGSVLPDRKFGILNIQSFINVLTGNLVIFDYQCILPSKNIPLEFYYIYNSQATTVDTIWRLAHKYFKTLPSASSSLAILVEIDGHETPYQFDPETHRWQSPYWSESRPYLVQDTTTEQWRWFDPKTQITEVYNQHGNLIERLNSKYESTRYFYSPTQTSSWRLNKISTSGADYEFRQRFIQGQRYESLYHINLDKLTLLKVSVFDVEGRLIRTYCPQRGLDASRVPQVNYTYKVPSYSQGTQPNDRDAYALSPLVKIEQSDGSYSSFIYDIPPHFAPRRLVQFNYENVSDTGIVLANFDYHPDHTTIQNYAKVASKIWFNAQGSITQVDRENGYPLTASHTVDSDFYTYHDSGQLASTTLAGQGSEYFDYDKNSGLLVKQQKANGLITEYYYDSTQAQYPLLIQVNHLKDQTQVIRKVYETTYGRRGQGLYLRFKITPKGRVTEYRLDSTGFIKNRLCYRETYFPVQSYSDDSAPTLSEMIAWVAQQDLQKITLTTYYYDNSGQLNHTYYYGTINEQGIGVDDDHRYHVNTRYTLFGDLYHHAEYRDTQQTPLRILQRYDLLRRLVYSCNPANEITTYAYDNNNRRVAITQPNGRKDITTWDTRGWIYKKQQQVQNNDQWIGRETTSYRRIVGGYTEKCVIQNGQFSYRFYDKQDRLGFIVETNGRLTEYRYDLQHRYKVTIDYAKALDKQKLSELPLPETEPTINHLFHLMKEMAIADSTRDRFHYDFYDMANRLVYEVDAEHYLQQTIYNEVDAVLAKIRYASPIQSETFAALLAGKLINIPLDPQQDRIQRTFYDDDQQKIGYQDAAGYVTEYKRNAAGWIIETIHYALPQLFDWQTQDLNKIRPTAHPNDAHDYSFYNARGWIILTVDAEGFITTRDYLLNGLICSEKRYAHPVDMTWYEDTAVIPPLPSDSPEDQTIDYKYDALNREIMRRQADGKESFTHYDMMGHVSATGIKDSTTIEINGDTYRAQQFQYDRWEQLTAEASVWNSEALAQIEANTLLSPDEKQKQSAVIWNEQTERHFYEVSGLKRATAVRPHPTASDQFRYFYYDTAGNLIVTFQVIDAQQVTIDEYTRDVFGNIIATRAYSQIESTFADQFQEPLTGGLITESLRSALTALQDNKNDIFNQKQYNRRNELIKSIDAQGYETHYTPNAFYEVHQSGLSLQTQQPSLFVQRQYDTRGLEIITQRRGGNLSLEVKHAYDHSKGKLTHLLDEIQGNYQFGYDRKARLIWTENPRKERSQVTYDAWDRPITTTNTLAQTTHYSYDSIPRREMITDPLGHSQIIIKNIFSEKIKEINAYDQIKIWQHAANGQVCQYQDALGRGFVSTYNLLGNITEKQVKNGAVTRYTYDARGQLITKIEAAQGIQRQTIYHYNHLGNLTKTLDPNGIVIENKYDLRGLVITQCLDPKKSGLNLMTQRNYNGQRQKISEILGNAEVENQYQCQFDYDALSRQCSIIVDPITNTRKTGLHLVTQQHKKGVDQIVTKIDANGHITRSIFDVAGRCCFTLNPLRGVTEWQYNAMDQRVLERQYQESLTEDQVNRLNEDTTPDELRSLLSPSSEDTITYWFYDKNGKERFILNYAHPYYVIEEKRYDALQRKIQTIQYSTPLFLPHIESLTTEKLVAHTHKIIDINQDRIFYFMYDKADQLRFLIDPQHGVTEQRFDEQGRLICQIGYANPVNDPDSLSQYPILEVNAHLKQDTHQDRYQFFYFDQFGQPTYNVQAEGQVIRYQHDANGNLTEEVHFQQHVQMPQAYSELLAQLEVLKPNSVVDRITCKIYDAANRLIQQTDPLGHQESYQLDALGHCVRYTDPQQFIWKTQFDRAKRAVIEITPEVTFTQVTTENSGLLVSTPQTIALEKQKHYDKVGNILRIVSAANTTEARIFEVEYNGLNQWQKNYLPDIAIDDASALKPNDWQSRPEIRQTLTTTRTINTKGLKVAEQDAAGHWSFWVYDTQKRLVYRVTPLGITIKKERDAFGKIHRKTTYAIPCTLDLTRYTGSGIPKSILDTYYRTHQSANDRVITYQRDQLGRVVLQRQGPVFYYTHHNTIDLDHTEIKKRYNLWGQIIARIEKVDSIRQKEQFYWFDRQGQCLVEVDNIGFDPKISHYRCTRFEYNTFAKLAQRYTYAKTLDLAITRHWSLTQLEQTLSALISSNDRCEKFYYDHADRLLEKVRPKVIRQTLTLVDGLPIVKDNSPDDLRITYQYNAKGQRITKIWEDGSIERSFYDARGCHLAQTEVTRDNHGLSPSITPLTHYGYNAHGQKVLTIRFKHGTKSTPTASIPTPIALDPEDQYEQQLFNTRGQLIWKQIGKKIPNGFSYTALGKPARQWWILTGWQITDEKKFTSKTDLDEKYFYYDAQSRPIQVEVRRNAQVVETTYTRYDTFDQAIGESKNPDIVPIYRYFDRLGRLWCTNAEKGVPIIYVYDLSGQNSLQLRSPTQDLGAISYQDIPNLLSLNLTELERTENQRDLGGRVINRSLPANYQIDTSQPQIIPLSILASSRYPKLGQIQSLSWPTPQEKNAYPEFSIWPKDAPEQKQSLEIKTDQDLCGVDVSTFATDVYQYEILYYFSNQNTNDSKILLYISSGMVQFSADDSKPSRHLVVLTDKEHTSLVRLAGNTQNIQRVEVWQEQEKRTTLDLQMDPNTHHYFVDLSTMASGVYQLKPQNKDKSDTPLSLAFTIYTDTPADKPLSREITSQLQFRFLETHVELNWQVSTFLQKQPVKLQCHYLDTENKRQTQECEIQAEAPRTRYTDKNGKILQSNVSFKQSIQSIETLSLAILSPLKQIKTAYVSSSLSNHWLLLNSVASESSDEEWEIIPSNDEHYSNKEENFDWIPLYQDEKPLLPKQEPDPSLPETISSLDFNTKYLLWVSPIALVDTADPPPILEYLDVSLDRMRCWKQFSTFERINEGLIVDIKGFKGGVYPFRCQENSGNLVVTLGGHVFPTQSIIEPDRQHLVQPACRYQYDVWNNKLSETNTLGHTTEFRYNDADQLLEKKEPLVEVVDEQGNTQTLSPITTSAYNTRGFLIAKCDPNAHTQGFILDAEGHRIIEVLAKGTQRKIQLFDALNHVYETRDGANQCTTYCYDDENNLVSFKMPSGKEQYYTYNERKQRTSDTDTTGYTHHYHFDLFGNLIERYEPLGQCTRMVYGPYHQMIRLENPESSVLTWQHDAFGKTIAHTDLSGAIYQYTYDYKGQLVEVTSQGGNHGLQLILEPVTYSEVWSGYRQQVVNVPGQHLRYQYHSGQVTEIQDVATGKKTTYRYDSEGRRFSIQVMSKQNEILRETYTQVDALGRETLTRDKHAVFTTAYDAASNRRFIKAEINIGSQVNPLKQEVWWKYDTEDKVIISEGLLKEGQIVLIPNQGSEFTYQDDRRITEKKLDLNGKAITATLVYDIDGHLIGSIYSNGEKTERSWTEDGLHQTYKTSKNDKIYRQQDNHYNENGWLTSTIQKSDQNNPINIDYQDLNALGLPQKQHIAYHDSENNQDYLDYHYIGWDQWQVESIGGRRYNRHGRSDYSSVRNLFGPNGEKSGIFGVQAQNSNDKENKYFETTPDGLVLRRINLRSNQTFISTNHWNTHYVYRVNGQFLGSYEYNQANASLGLNWIRHGQRNSAGQELGILQGNHPGQAVSFDPLSENNHFGDHDYFSSIPKTYVCVTGDRYEVIAEKIYGDASLASYIEAANGGGTLVAGQTIIIPQLVVVHNKSGMARPYYQFIQLIQGSLIPHLNTPQPRESFWGRLLCALASIVALVVAPHLAIVAIASAALGVSESIIIGVFVGLVEASAQGLCIGLGLKDQFSLAEALSAGISAGFTSSFGFPASASDLSIEETLQYVLQVGMMNVEEQLVEMAIGIRRQFDLAGVALAMGSAGLSQKIKLKKPWQKRVVMDLSSATMSSVVRGRFDIESLAIQLISDMTGLAVQQALLKASISHDYQQSQRASRTAKNWSYTTINQEWDALLVNDAKYVAHASLPALTIDVDDPEIAYQLGEQVSRFESPSSITFANNRHGFWQTLAHTLQEAEEVRLAFEYGKINAINVNYQEEMAYFPADKQVYFELGRRQRIYDIEIATAISKEIAENILAFEIGTLTAEITLKARKVGQIYELDKKNKFYSFFFKETQGERQHLANQSAIRGEKMLENNVGYNISPESTFVQYDQIGRSVTFLTDSEAISPILKQAAGTKFRVMPSHIDYIKYKYIPQKFWDKSFKIFIEIQKLEKNEYIISPYKAKRLEFSLGLMTNSLAKSDLMRALLEKGDKETIKKILNNPYLKKESMGRFRYTEVKGINSRSPRDPFPSDNVNSKYKGPGQGLPEGGPEKIINPVQTKTWPETPPAPKR